MSVRPVTISAMGLYSKLKVFEGMNAKLLKDKIIFFTKGKWAILQNANMHIKKLYR